MKIHQGIFLVIASKYVIFCKDRNLTFESYSFSDARNKVFYLQTPNIKKQNVCLNKKVIFVWLYKKWKIKIKRNVCYKQKNCDIICVEVIQ